MRFPECKNALKCSARTPLGELTAPLRSPSWIKGSLLLSEREGKEGEWGGVPSNKNLPLRHW